MINFKHFIFGYFWVAISTAAYGQSTENLTDLLSQVQYLQNRLKIQINGLEKIEHEQTINAQGSLDKQLRQALATYNTVITQNAKGRIEKISIINKKQHSEDNRIILPTRYQEGYFLVSVAISGNGALWQTVDMIVDTGAHFIVLPQTMMSDLGIVEQSLTLRKMQTANGEVSAKTGTLQEVRIAGEILENVAVAFIDDRLLANNKLLGISVLGRYKLVMDHEAKLITLFKN